MFSTSAEQWANDTFQHAELGDKRRTNRLVKVACSLANHIGQSLVQSLDSPADVEAAYRLTRNSAIAPQAIAEAGFTATVAHAQRYHCLLALEDTTTLSFSHASVADELGYTTSKEKSRGMQAHSVLLFAPEEQQVVGLIEQQRWCRDVSDYGKSRQRDTRPYEGKESYKWERASQAVDSRLGEQMANVISVCDREADIIEYLRYKTSQKQRFVIRSMQNRRIEESQDKLYDFISRLQSAGERLVQVRQKGGRQARVAHCDISYAEVTLKIPEGKSGEAVRIFYVGCYEKGPEDGLCWHLLTSEPVNSQEDAHKIFSYYERRWLIEEFHKAWKTGGTQVEALRMQSKDNLERMIVLLAFIAVRIHQLRFMGLNKEEAEKESCETVLSPLAWKLLWSKQEKRRVPKKAPSLHWAFINLGKLAGWYDSKRTGRVGWERLWEGWFRLQTLIDGYLLAKSVDLEI
ncbi:IS4-like element ISPlu9 family transposase [Photorhabdus laumondii subsp. laumondii]|uniref:Transposase, IS4 Familly n=7 Tax=Morganellaceae TaxID=1903414 RepID=Q7M7F0_PHOLL|nr:MULTISPECIES: IS4-like element ISPlu9 family transposase [Photorhabdus]AWK40310.1 transposase [Photorhabdus laumondii subsp. laumondii]AWK40330.1 transposase [Photorhabdus laumondii subsp. laumondii]AWK40979.1 transposase [Photorhabdus laumondii subsp. laumondii]AWK41009.1 transposase [Photorhabdus laumondii subsp. laumondii]AWK41231.1 transposase [Photorhabdus laumondii subsp. laumondii]